MPNMDAAPSAPSSTGDQLLKRLPLEIWLRIMDLMLPPDIFDTRIEKPDWEKLCAIVQTFQRYPGLCVDDRVELIGDYLYYKDGGLRELTKLAHMLWNGQVLTQREKKKVEAVFGEERADQLDFREWLKLAQDTEHLLYQFLCWTVALAYVPSRGVFWSKRRTQRWFKSKRTLSLPVSKLAGTFWDLFISDKINKMKELLAEGPDDADSI